MPTSVPHVRDVIGEHEDQTSAFEIKSTGPQNITTQPNATPHQLLITGELKGPIISPIDLLPFELLGAIFLCYLGLCRHVTDSALESNLPIPTYILTLVRVCRRWKSVAYGTPSAWSHIAVKLGQVTARMLSPKQAEPLFQRAAAHPLTFMMRVSPPWKKDHYEDDLNELLEVLGRLKPHFKAIIVEGVAKFSSTEGHRWSSVFALLDHLTTHPQSTRYMTVFGFQLIVSGGGSAGQSLPSHKAHIVQNAFSTFSALTTLGIRAGFLQPSCSILQQIKHLQVSNISSTFGPDDNDILPILHACPVLESLTIIAAFFPNLYPATKITLPYLRRLEVAGCNEVDAVLAKLQAPMLHELLLSSDYHFRGQGNVYRHAFKNFLGQETGVPALRRLELYLCPVPEKALVQALQHLPTLLDLIIHEHDKLGAQFAGALSKPPTARKGWLCPNLRMLEIQDCSPINVSHLTQLIDSRSRGTIDALEQVGGLLGKRDGEDFGSAAKLESVMFDGRDLMTVLIESEQKTITKASSLAEDELKEETELSDCEGF